MNTLRMSDCFINRFHNKIKYNIILKIKSSKSQFMFLVIRIQNIHPFSFYIKYKMVYKNK